MERIAIFICATLMCGMAAASDPVWVKVAAAGSTAEAKAAADFVCAGTNDQETIQKAIDLCAKDGRNLYLYNGLYMIDAFREWGDGGPRAALRWQHLKSQRKQGRRRLMRCVPRCWHCGTGGSQRPRRRSRGAAGVRALPNSRGFAIASMNSPNASSLFIRAARRLWGCRSTTPPA